MAKVKTLRHDDAMITQIKEDPNFAMEYLNAALHSDSETWFEEFMIALGHFANALGVSATSLSQGRSRDAIYKAFSKHRNPTIKTLKNILDGMGVEMVLRKRVASR